jgi:hypothetical protein
MINTHPSQHSAAVRPAAASSSSAATADAPQAAASTIARRRRRRALVVAGALAVTSGGAVVVVPRLLFGDGADHAAVASIEHDATYQEPALLAQAFALPVAAAYVAGGLEYQRNASFCGPTTAVDVERSLGATDDQAHVLDGTEVRTTFGVVWGGLTLDEEAELVRRKTGRRVTLLRDLDLSGLREELRHANDPARRYTVNFSRGPLFGRGGGHHSPIGGYLADRDLVLVLDVNQHYKPWLVKTERLFQAVDTIDRKTNRKRGLLRIE